MGEIPLELAALEITDASTEPEALKPKKLNEQSTRGHPHLYLVPPER